MFAHAALATPDAPAIIDASSLAPTALSYAQLHADSLLVRDLVDTV
jgi:hypothetical protein